LLINYAAWYGLTYCEANTTITSFFFKTTLLINCETIQNSTLVEKGLDAAVNLDISTNKNSNNQEFEQIKSIT